MPLSPVTVFGKAEDYSETFYLYQVQGRPVGRSYQLYVAYYLLARMLLDSTDTV